jgi:enamine deaminase RidA (YjgF/YER057c/UK114 family)
LGIFTPFNRIYEEYSIEAESARATVQAARLPKEVVLQIEAIAIG